MIDGYSSLMQISARTTSRNKDDKCFKALTIMFKAKTYVENQTRDTVKFTIHLKVWNSTADRHEQC